MLPVDVTPPPNTITSFTCDEGRSEGRNQEDRPTSDEWKRSSERGASRTEQRQKSARPSCGLSLMRKIGSAPPPRPSHGASASALRWSTVRQRPQADRGARCAAAWRASIERWDTCRVSAIFSRLSTTNEVCDIRPVVRRYLAEAMKTINILGLSESRRGCPFHLKIALKNEMQSI